MLKAGAAAAIGALAFAVFLVAVYARRPVAVIKMDTDLRTSTRGFFPVERVEDVTYAWTSSRAELSVPGLDRRVEWRWTCRLMMGRPASVPPPHVRVAADGIVVFERTIDRNVRMLEATIPRRTDSTGMALAIDITPGFVPSSKDPRELGLAIDSMSLEPLGGWPWPPLPALVGGTLAVLAFGAALAAMRLPFIWVLGCALVAAGSQAWLMTRGLAAYQTYPLRSAETAVALGLGSLLAVWVFDRIRREPLGASAREVMGLSATACYLKLLILLHPLMRTGDGVFHAHRFENVLAGNFYFTSLAPGNYAFPYPIALYVVAAPFSLLAHNTLDRVALLRIVVTVSDAVVGALIYWMMVRTTANRLAAVAAVVWYHLFPVTAWIMTWGNLTNAFGQALFVTSLVIVAAMPVDSTRPGSVALLAALAATALLAHPSTAAILAVILTLTSILYAWRGGPPLQPAARGVAVAALIAGVAAFGLYYAWFPSVYRRELGRVASEAATRALEPGTSLAVKLAAIPRLADQFFGWPAVLAAGFGTWQWYKGNKPPRLTLLLVGWVGSCLLFLAVGLLTPIDLRYHFAAFPAVALTAAWGWSRAWQGGLTLRIGATVVLVAAIWIGVRQWIGMLV